MTLIHEVVYEVWYLTCISVGPVHVNRETCDSSHIYSHQSLPVQFQVTNCFWYFALILHCCARTFVFEIKIPKAESTTDSSSTTGSDEDIHTLNRALKNMERKMAIVNGVKNMLRTMGVQRSDGCDSEQFYDAPVFRVSELPMEYTDTSQVQI